MYIWVMGNLLELAPLFCYVCCKIVLDNFIFSSCFGVECSFLVASRSLGELSFSLFSPWLLGEMIILSLFDVKDYGFVSLINYFLPKGYWMVFICHESNNIFLSMVTRWYLQLRRSTLVLFTLSLNGNCSYHTRLW